MPVRMKFPDEDKTNEAALFYRSCIVWETNDR